MLSKLNKFLGELFKYPEIFIKENNIQTNIRKSKISLNDTIYYRFKYIFEEDTNTFSSITSNINFNNKMDNFKHKYFSRTGIYKKEKKLPVQLYKNIFDKIKDYYIDNFNCKNFIITIDGVYSNTNILHNGKIETAMNLGFYDSNNNFPLDIHFTGEGKKNNECSALKDYISNNLDYFKGKTIVCDRAYYCYSFFNFLINNNINFIIRLRDKAFNVEPNKSSRHFKEYTKIKNNKNINVITETIKTSKFAVNDTKEVNTIEKETIIKLITNLKNYDDDKILELYKSRWSIEEFYKQLKHNFKFQNFKEHKEESYNKNIYSSLTIALLKQILLKCYENNKKFKNKIIVSKSKDKEITIIKSINENLMIKGIKEELLRKLIYGKLNSQLLEIYLDSYIEININEINRHNERKSKRPFTKWYVKQYHDVYKIKKKCLDEEIKYFLKSNNNEIVKELKQKRKNLNKEFKNLKKELKEHLEKTKDESKNKS